MAPIRDATSGIRTVGCYKGIRQQLLEYKLSTFVDNIILKTILFFLIFSTLTCSEIKNKSIEESKFRINNVTDYHLLKLKGNVKFVEFTTYNENNHLIDSKSYKFNTQKETAEHEYKNINKISVREIKAFNKNGTNIKSETYKNSQLVKSEHTIDSVDQYGNILQQITFTNKGMLKRSINFKYNSNNKVKSFHAINKENNEFTIGNYTYNEASNLIEFIYQEFNKDTVQIKKIVDKYNNYGLGVFQNFG